MPMTVLTERITPFKESNDPNSIVFVRYLDAIGIAPYGVCHDELALSDNLHNPDFQYKEPEVTDGGFITIEDGYLEIAPYKTNSCVISRTSYPNPIDRKIAWRQIRRETAQILANTTHTPVKLMFDHDDDFENFHPQ